jgi:hypothetical protein
MVRRHFRLALLLLLAGLLAVNAGYLFVLHLQGSAPCLADSLAITSPAEPNPPPELLLAQEDARRIMRGEEPAHAKLVAGMADGGSTFYQADAYTITVWKSLYTVGDKNGYVRGFTVAMTNHPTPPGLSHTWFEAR